MKLPANCAVCKEGRKTWSEWHCVGANCRIISKRLTAIPPVPKWCPLKGAKR
jgi:hypothetical protein